MRIFHTNQRANAARLTSLIPFPVKFKTKIGLTAVKKMALSEKLKKLRDDKNWSQQTLVDMMKMDRSTVSRYETGKSVPTYQNVIRFAEVYQVEKEYLVAELDSLLPITEESGYILKGNLEDPDLGIIVKLLQQEPDLKISI